MSLVAAADVHDVVVQVVADVVVVLAAGIMHRIVAGVVAARVVYRVADTKGR